MDVGKAEESTATQNVGKMPDEDLMSMCEEIRKGYSPCDVYIGNLIFEGLSTQMLILVD